MSNTALGIALTIVSLPADLWVAMLVYVGVDIMVDKEQPTVPIWMKPQWWNLKSWFSIWSMQRSLRK
jgi:hypothetical protein